MLIHLDNWKDEVNKMSDFENKQDIIDSMAEKLMLNFRISPAKAYEVVESILHPLKLLPLSYELESEE